MFVTRLSLQEAKSAKTAGLKNHDRQRKARVAAIRAQLLWKLEVFLGTR